MKYYVALFCFSAAMAQNTPTPVLKRFPAPHTTVQPAPLPVAPQPDLRVELFSPAREPLDTMAAAAVRVSRALIDRTPSPVAAEHGKVQYTYGVGLPVLVCAPLRVCLVELQPGEKLVGEPHIGDAVRWHIAPAAFGPEAKQTQVVVIKPQDPDIQTNLLLMTDRRAYYLRLVSSQSDYIATVAFRYPEDDVKKWLASVAPPPPEPKIMPAIVTADKLNFQYKWGGGKDWMRPLRVYDDSVHTYLVMSPEMKSRQAPAFVVTDDGATELVNYRVRDNTYIVDRLFEKAELRVMNGKKKVQRTKIEKL